MLINKVFTWLSVYGSLVFLISYQDKLVTLGQTPGYTEVIWVCVNLPAVRIRQALPCPRMGRYLLYASWGLNRLDRILLIHASLETLCLTSTSLLKELACNVKGLCGASV